MFERSLKSSTIHLRVTDEEKVLIQRMASRSPQGDTTNWLMHLIKQEYDRCKEFDKTLCQK